MCILLLFLIYFFLILAFFFCFHYFLCVFLTLFDFFVIAFLIIPLKPCPNVVFLLLRQGKLKNTTCSVAEMIFVSLSRRLTVLYLQSVRPFSSLGNQPCGGGRVTFCFAIRFCFAFAWVLKHMKTNSQR